MNTSPKISESSSFRPLIILIGILLLCVILVNPVFAHHPFDGMGELNLLTSLLSGLAHPVLGVDHLLFLISIGFASKFVAQKFLPYFLATGFLGAVLSQASPSFPGLEIILSLSVVISAFIAIGEMNILVLLPLIFFHGFALGNVIIGNEPTILFGYFIGLFFSQLLLIKAGIYSFNRFYKQRKTLIGFILGAGLTITFGMIF